MFNIRIPAIPIAINGEREEGIQFTQKVSQVRMITCITTTATWLTHKLGG